VIAMAKELLVIGIDGAVFTLVKKFHEDGVIPNISSLMENGVLAEAYPCPPCDTPTNWTTIATGATTATHGATSFYMHIPGEPLDLGLRKRERSQLSRFCKAEYLWNIAERHGLTPFVINYPAGWPSKFKRGAMSLYSWTMPESLPRVLASSATYTFSASSVDARYRILRAESVPSKFSSLSPPLQVRVPIEGGLIERPLHIKAIILDSRGDGYDSLALQVKDKVHYVKRGSWSDWLELDIKTKHGVLRCLFRVKVLEISPDGTSLRLHRTDIFNTKGWTQPESLAEQFIKNSLICIEPQVGAVPYDIFGRESAYVSSSIREAKSLVEIIGYMKRTIGWRVCFVHYHLLDSINHRFAAPYEGLPESSSGEVEVAQEAMRRAYKIVDDFVGDLLKRCVSEDTVVALVSDHGAVPTWKVVNLPMAFVREGLLSYKWDERLGKYVVDWSKTLAFPYFEPPYVWVNLKGREPHGVVEPKHYEEVRDRVIEALYSIRDPENGQRVIELALRREDARPLGLGGERDGDVVYFLKPPYEIFDGRLELLNAAELPPDAFAKSEVYGAERVFGAHAYYLPTARSRNFTVSAVLIMSGPGIRRGVELKKPIYLTDLAPTLAHLMALPVPKDAEGRILYEALE